MKLLLIILSLVMTAVILFCMNIAAVSASRPIIESISGPIAVDCESSVTAHFSAIVKGGTPPYTYKWEGSNEVIYEGTQYAQITIGPDKFGMLHNNGEFYWLQLFVTDSKGQAAAWISDVMVRTEFDYAVGCERTPGDSYFQTVPQFPYTSASEDKTSNEEKNVVNPIESGNPTAVPTSAEDIPGFTSISREIEYSTDGGKSWNPAKQDTKIKMGYQIRASEDSSAIIGWADGTTLKLAPESHIVITQEETTSKIGMIAGDIWVNFKKTLRNEAFSFDMHDAAGGTKGTTFVLHQDSENSTLKLIEGGPVEFRSKADNRTTIILPGEMINANNKGTNIKEGFNVTKEIQTWDKIKSTSKKSSSVLFFVVGIMIILVVIGYFTFIKKKH